MEQLILNEDHEYCNSISETILYTAVFSINGELWSHFIILVWRLLIPELEILLFYSCVKQGKFKDSVSDLGYMLSLFDSIWPVPLGFLLALVFIMAFSFRKRLFNCLRGKHSSIESATSRQNGELNTSLDQSEIQEHPLPSLGAVGQQSSGEIVPYPLLILPNHPSDVSIISSPVNATVICENHGSTRNEELETLDVQSEAPPPSYSSLFYCPPPKYEDVIVGAQ